MFLALRIRLSIPCRMESIGLHWAAHSGVSAILLMFCFLENVLKFDLSLRDEE